MRGFVALEDVTIVIPIAVAIVLFFSALAWAISTIQDTNSSVDLTLKIVDLADLFTSPGVITQGSFKQACNSAFTTVTGLGFSVYVTSADNPQPCADVQGGWVCTSRSDGSACPPQHVTSLTRAFPVPLQESRDGLPYNDVNLLVVTVWKEG